MGAGSRGPSRQGVQAAGVQAPAGSAVGQPHPAAHRLRLSCTPSTDEGKERDWMTELECVLSSVSLRGVRCACSPAPTKATRLVQNSILAVLRRWAGQVGRVSRRRKPELPCCWFHSPESEHAQPAGCLSQSKLVLLAATRGPASRGEEGLQVS